MSTIQYHTFKLLYFSLNIVIPRLLSIMFVLFYTTDHDIWVTVMVVYTTINNVSAISQLSVLLVEETGVSRENHRLAATY